MSGTRSPVTELLIFGAGGMGQEVADLATSAEIEVLGFIDDEEELHGRTILGFPVLGGRRWLAGKSDRPVLVAVGAPERRRRICQELTPLGVRQFPALVHPTAYVGRGCHVAPGSVVSAAATLTADVHLGRNVIVNTGATVSHNSHLADFATIAPGVHLAGNTRVDEGADIGIGAATIQGVTIGAWSKVGAGAVVLRDVAPDCTVVGCPAKVITERKPGWHL